MKTNSKRKLTGNQKRRLANKSKIAGPHFPKAFASCMAVKMEEALKFEANGTEKLTPFQQIALSRGLRKLRILERRRRARR